MTQNGKGSQRRPAAIDAQTIADNWERTFRRREPPPEYYEAIRRGTLPVGYTGNWELDRVRWERGE